MQLCDPICSNAQEITCWQTNISATDEPMKHATNTQHTGSYAVSTPTGKWRQQMAAQSAVWRLTQQSASRRRHHQGSPVSSAIIQADALGIDSQQRRKSEQPDNAPDASV